VADYLDESVPASELKARTKVPKAATPWDRSRQEVLTRSGCELERGVNYFVTALEKLGAKTTYSCEGHPKGFYIVFQGTYDLAHAIANAGYFQVEIERGRGEFSLRLMSNEVGHGPTWDEKAKRECLRWASEAWEKAFFPEPKPLGPPPSPRQPRPSPESLASSVVLAPDANPFVNTMFEGDGRIRLTPAHAPTDTFPVSVTRAEARRQIQEMLQNGQSGFHSPRGATLWVPIAYCRECGLNYSLTGDRVQGYIVTLEPKRGQQP
jgi:hypothetical protein